MWVIVAKKGLHIHRDDLISELLDVDKDPQPDIYLKKSSYGKFSTTSFLQESVLYKQLASCKRLINKFEKFKSVSTVPRWDRFYYMKEYHLSFRKVSKEEWERMCNDEITKLTISYNYHKEQLEKKKFSYK
jgi:hypothetical protein